ncbi:MAG: hypothetical protein KKA32_01460 [Actinobacteria bacterium]|nr:hypothetical protein [Actinomycetota bacterium]
MKTLPTVVASARHNIAVALDQFDGVERATNRDAFDFLFESRPTPTSDQGLLVVRFSGTVMGTRPADFGLPQYDDRETMFRVFSEAAIGDALDEKSEVPIALPDQPVHTIDCFSPHFQMWHDRQPATDEEIERYVIAHVFWAWQFNFPNWRVGPSDVLRLKRPWPDILRMIALHEGHEWAVSNPDASGVTVTPSTTLIRDQRQQGRPEARPAVERLGPEPTPVPAPSPAVFVYVDESRIADNLRGIEAPNFDLRKLVALCEELNQCYRAQCYHAVAALTRVVIDHVPPLFGVRSFIEVANNYPGSRSFKASMQQLETAARAIADQHLHTQIRNSEVLPTRVQVDFSQVVDVLLAEIVRLLQPRNGDAA